MTHSVIYEGHVHHRRQRPIRHEFRYALYLLYLDLDELDTVFRGRWFWSTRRRALARFCREDHLGDPSVPLSAAVRDLVQSETGQRPEGPIRLLTQLRYFGYAMNPVCLYYCFDRSGQHVETIVADVNNTPWGEQHCYVLEPNPAPHGKHSEAAHAKTFHVSPFMGMDQEYRWKLTEPGEHVSVRIDSFEEVHKLFDATMTLHRRPLTTWQLARVLLRYPFITGKVVAAIYWQALRLWWKRCPFHPHPKSIDPSIHRKSPCHDTTPDRATQRADTRPASHERPNRIRSPINDVGNPPGTGGGISIAGESSRRPLDNSR
jgi:hypothetical protein